MLPHARVDPKLRAAVEHSLKSDPSSGLQLLVHAKDFWLRCIDPMELGLMLGRVIEAYQKPDELTALGLGLRAEACNSRGDAAGALCFSEECLALAETLGDQKARAGFGKVTMQPRLTAQSSPAPRSKCYTPPIDYRRLECCASEFCRRQKSEGSW